MDYRKAGVMVMILGLLPAYIALVNTLPSDISFGGCGVEGSQGATENVGFCTEVSATVERSYYFGLVDLKTKALGANINPLTKLMPYIVLFLAAGSYRFFKQER